jgi:type IV pilus assembly protein PilM
VPRLSRDIHVGGANFTKKLMDIFEIDFKAAEELKINPTPDKLDKITAGVESVLLNLATEIRTSFDYYESQNTSSVVKIFLSGGSSKAGGLKEKLSSALGIPVETWDPFKQIKISDKIDIQKLNQFSGQFNIAVGLALR